MWESAEWFRLVRVWPQIDFLCLLATDHRTMFVCSFICLRRFFFLLFYFLIHEFTFIIYWCWIRNLIVLVFIFLLFFFALCIAVAKFTNSIQIMRYFEINSWHFQLFPYHIFVVFFFFHFVFTVHRPKWALNVLWFFLVSTQTTMSKFDGFVVFSVEKKKKN